MSNEDTVRKFFLCYQAHDFKGMQSCLDENVKFSDFAYEIEGINVKAMWHWFCVPFGSRKEPVDVPKFEIIKSDIDIVLAKYRVKYRYGEKQKPVDYFINAHFKLQNDKILEQKDTFGSISQFEFAEKALGFPFQFLALTPLLRWIVKNEAAKKLNHFKETLGYTD
jgi:hypothetical protein